jgi:hypothetical protein
MVQVIDRPPDIYDTLAGLLGETGKGFGTGIQASISDFFEQQKQTRQSKQAEDFFSQLDPTASVDQKLQSILGSKLTPEMKKLGMTGILEQEKLGEKRRQQNMIFDLLGYNPTPESGGVDQPEGGPASEYHSAPQRTGTGLSTRSEDQLDALIATGGPAAELGKAELQRRDRRATINAKGSQKFIEGIAQRATDARKAIRNKENQLRLIAKGDLDNPLVAQIADFLPKGFGNMLLSADSQLYRSTMFDEFGIIKNMFPGQIRTKEIELLEDKLADLFKNDEAKKAIIANGMEKANADIIRAQAAREVMSENPDLNVLDLEEAIEEKAAPELQKLYDKIINEYERIAKKFEAGGSETPGKIKSVAKLPKAADLPNGSVVTNKETGERLKVVNGKYRKI